MKKNTYLHQDLFSCIIFPLIFIATLGVEIYLLISEIEGRFFKLLLLLVILTGIVVIISICGIFYLYSTSLFIDEDSIMFKRNVCRNTLIIQYKTTVEIANIKDMGIISDRKDSHNRDFGMSIPRRLIHRYDIEYYKIKRLFLVFRDKDNNSYKIYISCFDRTVCKKIVENIIENMKLKNNECHKNVDKDSIFLTIDNFAKGVDEDEKT